MLLVCTSSRVFSRVRRGVLPLFSVPSTAHARSLIPADKAWSREGPCAFGPTVVEGRRAVSPLLAARGSMFSPHAGRLEKRQGVAAPAGFSPLLTAQR